jgi:hypothetical protein
VSEIETEIQTETDQAPEIETEVNTETIWEGAIKCCQPYAVSRGILELCNRFMPDEPFSEQTQTADGGHIPNAAAHAAVFALEKLLGPFHPACRQLRHDLRESIR